jgi:type II secretory pathway pseudopilin PulG
MRLRATTIRRAFTLIELIVVLGIIILLTTLTAAAVMRYQQGQRESNTNTHLLKIHQELEKQWAAKVALIKSEPVPQAILEATKNADGTYDMARARAFHMKMRLRQEFPQTFGEVYSKLPVPANGQTYIYDGKQAFKNALKNPLMLAPNQYAEPSPEAQSAALLVLILSQGGGGSTTDVDAIAKTSLLENFAQQGGGAISLKVFVDEWGTQIAFRRQADDDMTDVIGVLGDPTRPGDLNQQPFVSAAQMQKGNLDPQDPDGRLKMTWPNYTAAKNILAQPDPTKRPYIAEPFDGRNRGPFVISAGKNGLFYRPNTNPPVWETDLDNLYSYRLAQTRRGN